MSLSVSFGGQYFILFKDLMECHQVVNPEPKKELPLALVPSIMYRSVDTESEVPASFEFLKSFRGVNFRSFTPSCGAR